MSLVDRLKIDTHRGFAPRARYYSHGDFVTYFISPSRCKARRVNSLVTVFTDEKTGDLVGCKVKGIGKLMSTLKMACVMATDGKVLMGMLFLSAAAIDGERKQEVLDLSNTFGKAEVPVEEVCEQAA